MEIFKDRTVTLLAVPRVPRFCYYCDLLLKNFVFYLCHFFCYHCDLLLNSLTVTRNLFVNLFKKKLHTLLWFDFHGHRFYSITLRPFIPQYTRRIDAIQIHGGLFKCIAFFIPPG